MTPRWARFPQRPQTALLLVALSSCGSPRPLPVLTTVQPASTQFDPSVSPRLELDRAKPGQLLVRPAIDQQDLGWFILDTGAGAMAIAPSAARRAKLPAVGQVRASGVAGSAMTSVVEGDTLALGPVRLSRPQYVEVRELDGLLLRSTLGPGIVGVCGYDVFGAAIVEIDSLAGQLTLHDPRAYEWPDGYSQELVLIGHRPAVRCRFEGEREGLFTLDTGANTTVIFHAPAVEQFKLLEGRQTRAGSSGGVGGLSSTPRGTLAWFELGGRRFYELEVGFSKASQGAHTSTETMGTIGMELLGKFRLVIDYGGRRIAWLPRP